MKVYHWRGSTYQFDENDVPADAVEVKSRTPENKAVAPKNKAVQDDSKPRRSRPGRQGD